METFGGEVLRQILLSVHYRSKMEWNEDVIERAIRDLERLYTFARDFNRLSPSEDGQKVGSLFEHSKDCFDKMQSFIADDFNIPGAMAEFFKLIRNFNSAGLDNSIFKDHYQFLKNTITYISKATGLVSLENSKISQSLAVVNQAKKALSGKNCQYSEQDIENLILERKKARIEKNWARADEIREVLKKAGIVLKDNPDGTISWQYE